MNQLAQFRELTSQEMLEKIREVLPTARNEEYYAGIADSCYFLLKAISNADEKAAIDQLNSTLNGLIAVSLEKRGASAINFLQ